MWGAICSVCSSIISSVGSSIAKAVSGIGSALSSFVTTVAPVIGSVIESMKPIAKALGEFSNVFLQALGILKPDEKIEELGERALQAASKGITLEKYENFDDYMNELRSFDLDPEISSKRSTAEKIVAGLGVGTIGVEEKFNAERGSFNEIWMLPLVNPTYFTPERMQGLIVAGRLGGEIFSYLEKRLDGADSSSFRKSLELTPEGKVMTDPEQAKLYEALNTARENWADIAKQMEEKNKAG
jgi:hypothetical protein